MGVPEFIRALEEHFVPLDHRDFPDPLFLTLRAQVRWYRDKETSARDWDAAVALDDSPMALNARASWEKQVEGNVAEAERHYRAALERFPKSP